METTIISATEDISKCIQDGVTGNNPERSKPEGYVEIYDVNEAGEKQLIGKHNLVVYQGREWIASRIVNVENTNIDARENEYISWFGLGDGGAPSGDPLTPTSPISTISGLSNEIAIIADDANCADLRSGNYYKHPFDSIEFQQDTENDNSWLIAKISTTIGTDDANGENLNEAALFTSTSNAGEHTGPFHLYSIVTFPTIVKDNTRQIMFLWYLYC